MVFVTGQAEVRRLVKLLSDIFPQEMPNTENEPKKELNLDNFEAVPRKKEEKTEENLESELHLNEEDDEFGEFQDFDDHENFEISTTALDKTLPMVALPLYSVLSKSEQKNVFENFEEPIRKVVVATNVAETSLTIPGESCPSP